MITFGSTIQQAERAMRGHTSNKALRHHEDSGRRATHRDRVLAMWQYLSKNQLLPCSTKRAAEIVTEVRGENYFSAGQTNYDVIRKRTADLMAEVPCQLRLVQGRKDDDGVERDQYEVAG